MSKQEILNIIHSMEEGEEIILDRRVMRDTFSCGWPSIYNTPIEHLLSNLMGSGFGVYRARTKLETGDVVVSKHKESNKRYYIDPDRAYMFNKMPDGTLELKNEYKAQPQQKD